MRIHDIIHPGQRCRLRHPTVGDVLWTDEPGQGFALVWPRGREMGWALVADEAVLLDDGWKAAPLTARVELEDPQSSEWDFQDGRLQRRRGAGGGNAKALRRFLRGQVGPPWGQVRAEIDARCRALRTDPAVRERVRQSVLSVVDTEVCFRKGDGWVNVASGRRCELFVHPENGRLCQQEKPLRE